MFRQTKQRVWCKLVKKTKKIFGLLLEIILFTEYNLKCIDDGWGLSMSIPYVVNKLI